MTYISGTISLDYLYSNGLLNKIIRGGYAPDDTSSKKSQVYSFLYDKFGRSTKISVAGNDLVTYSYAKNGSYDPKSMTYGNGAVVNYVYDIFGRMIKQTYSGTNSSGDYSYTYDANGNLWRIADSTDSNNPVVYDYDYDSLGRLIRSNKKKNGVTQIRTEHQYDSENRVKKQSWQLPGRTYTETYTYNNSNGCLTKLETSKGTLAFGYDDLLRQTTKLSDQFRETYTYTTQAGNANQTSTQIAQIAYTGVTSYFTNTTLGYTYDALGNIKTVSRDGVTTEYSYDNQGQLTKEETRNASNAITSTYTYTYDTYGNIREKKEYSGAATSGNLEKTYTYNYPTNGWLDELTGISIDGGAVQNFTYDAIGNPLTYQNGTNWTFTWKNGRQLATANASGKNISYTYDANGIRSSKTVNGVTHSYTTLNGQVVRETWTENGTAHKLDIVTDNAGRPYALVYDGTTYYYVLNQQGDVIRLVDGNGATYANYSYNAWGEPVRVYLDNGSEITAADHIANLNPIRYRGYYYDTDTGFYYLQSRYYDPVLCRFLNADGYASTGSGFAGYNMYAYCNNNPVNMSDPTGTCSCKYNGTSADFIRLNQGLPPQNCHHGQVLDAVQRGERNKPIPVNIQYSRPFPNGYGTETFTIPEVTCMTIEESRLKYNETIDNAYYGSRKSSAGGTGSSFFSAFLGAVISEASQSVVFKAIGQGLTWGGLGYAYVSVAEYCAYQAEVDANASWKAANNSGAAYVIEVSWDYQYNGNEFYGYSYKSYYPWNGRDEIPLP